MVAVGRPGHQRWRAIRILAQEGISHEFNELFVKFVQFVAYSNPRFCVLGSSKVDRIWRKTHTPTLARFLRPRGKLHIS